MFLSMERKMLQFVALLVYCAYRYPKGYFESTENTMETSKLIVIAIGGNSLIEDSKHVTVSAQYEAARKTANHIVKLVEAGHRVVIAHGNGPQVGFILLRAEYAKSILHAVPLDSCVADTQGAIGYQLQMALHNEFVKVGLMPQIATVVTQVVVDPNDVSFKKPTKPIGSFMSKEDADNHRLNDGWDIVEDAGRGYRRVVASPKPVSIVELDTVKTLVDNNVIVIAAGGGGIPVVRHADGSFEGKEAVIDKDLAAALMAKELKADMFVISTAVEKVCLNYGKPEQRELDTIDLAECQQYVDEGHFAPGSMLPKIQAMMDFVKTTGIVGLITNPENIYGALYEGKGTKIVH
jgi:carbamate kinase